MDYRQYYLLEPYLFGAVHRRFEKMGYLGAFDLFCIVIWKANRSKSKIAKRLLDRAAMLVRPGATLEDAAHELTAGAGQRPDAKERLRYLWTRQTWGLRLPMASAILTVLYPDEFTVYDVRVCEMLVREELGDFHHLAHLTRFGAVWEGYQAFTHAVEAAVPHEPTLRDKDRYLWGKSFCEQLEADLAGAFSAPQGDDSSGADRSDQTA